MRDSQSRGSAPLPSSIKHKSSVTPHAPSNTLVDTGFFEKRTPPEVSAPAEMGGGGKESSLGARSRALLSFPVAPHAPNKTLVKSGISNKRPTREAGALAEMGGGGKGSSLSARSRALFALVSAHLARPAAARVAGVALEAVAPCEAVNLRKVSHPASGNARPVAIGSRYPYRRERDLPMESWVALYSVSAE